MAAAVDSADRPDRVCQTSRGGEKGGQDINEGGPGRWTGVLANGMGMHRVVPKRAAG